MSTKLMRLPLTLAAVQAWQVPALEEIVKGLGDHPDAVCDFIDLQFTKAETRIIVTVYRNQDAWALGIPLPGFPVIELRLTRAEHVALAAATPAFAALEAGVRDAAWSLMTTHPKMLRGTPPAEGEQDTRQNMFSAGELVDVA